MRTAELRGMNREDLAVYLAEAREELFNLRFQNATGRIDNYKRLRTLRREVARIETIIREAELGIDRTVPEETDVVERPRRRLFRRNLAEQTGDAGGSDDGSEDVEDVASSDENEHEDVESDNEEQE